jgi:hypothetical protein
LEAALVYTPLVPAGQTASAAALPEGHFESEAESGRTTSATFWQERVYTISLDNHTATLFWDALHQGQTVLSFSYAFLAPGIGPDEPLAELTGTPELLAALRKQLAPSKDEAQDSDDKPTQSYIVHAGSVAVEVDAEKWPELFVEADLNEGAPPGYAVLEVRCYDFNNELRADLAEKQVEIRAEGVTGREATLFAVFESDQPDLYVQHVRFPVAVRLDRPYRVRVTEVAVDGTETPDEWIQMDSWARMLDITTLREKMPPASEETTGEEGTE